MSAFGNPLVGRVLVDHPYRFDAGGRTATTSYTEHVADLVELTLLTSPGERVNRPEFGAGLSALVFEPNSRMLAESTEFVVRAAVERWLSDLIGLDSVSVSADDSSLVVDLAYVVLETGDRTQQTVRVG